MAVRICNDNDIAITENQASILVCLSFLVSKDVYKRQVQIVEEETAQEKLRPQWKRLLASLDRGDELVVAKFSNAVQGLRELSTLLEFCRVKVVRLISVRDRIDTGDKLFPDTTTSQIMQMFGSLPEEVMVLRRAEAHVQYLQQHIKPTRFKTLTAKEKAERENMIVSMYNNGHTLDEMCIRDRLYSITFVCRLASLGV